MRMVFRRKDGTTLTFGVTRAEVTGDNGFFVHGYVVTQFALNAQRSGWLVDGIPDVFVGWVLN